MALDSILWQLHLASTLAPRPIGLGLCHRTAQRRRHQQTASLDPTQQREPFDPVSVPSCMRWPRAPEREHPAPPVSGRQTHQPQSRLDECPGRDHRSMPIGNQYTPRLRVRPATPGRWPCSARMTGDQEHLFRSHPTSVFVQVSAHDPRQQRESKTDSNRSHLFADQTDVHPARVATCRLVPTRAQSSACRVSVGPWQACRSGQCRRVSFPIPAADAQHR